MIMIANRSIGQRFELIIIDEKELQSSTLLFRQYTFKSMYIVPELVTAAAVSRSHLNANFDIYAMVDYPKGSKKSTNKFHGMSTDFFMADGYDIVLSNYDTHDKLYHEIKEVSTFVKNMINPVAKICLTLNCSEKDDKSIQSCVEAAKNYGIDKIKLESLTRLQPTKANSKTHLENVSNIKQLCSIPIILCGNVNKKIYNEMNNILAVSPQQMDDISQSILNESKMSQV